MSHPILDKLGVRFNELTIRPRSIQDIQELEQMIFIQNKTDKCFILEIPEDGFTQKASIAPQSVENFYIKHNNDTVQVHVYEFVLEGDPQTNKRDYTMKRGEILTITETENNRDL